MGKIKILFPYTIKKENSSMIFLYPDFLTSYEYKYTQRIEGRRDSSTSV